MAATMSPTNTANDAEPPPRRSRRRRAKELGTGALFALPAIVLLGAFLIAPFVLAVFSSFTDQRLVPNPNLPTEWVGFRNYTRLFEDESFRSALIFNGIFVLVVVPLQTAMALGLAVLVNQKVKFRNGFRTVYFAPVAVVMVVVAVMWGFFFNPTSGLINGVLDAVSFGYLTPERFEFLNWLLDRNGARAAIIIMSIWQGVGFQMVIYLAGLQAIPNSLYEAARIDGASAWQQFRHVTLPQLRNTTIFVVLSTTILAFALFDQVKVLTEGGPQDATQTMMLRLINFGFERGQVGLGSALGVFYFVLVLIIAFLQRRLLKEERTVDAS
ncbi:MAG: sugar ABC transporter permease [Actinomycetota bacterium]